KLEVLAVPVPPDDGGTPTASEPQPATVVAPEPPQAQQTLFGAPETRRPAILKALSPEEMTRLYSALGKGEGTLEVPAIYIINGERIPGTIKNCRIAEIPEEFLNKAVWST
ncbi:MAG TPA: hypothetical protein VGR71_05160, partial [Nitrospira sp.]|nr:hypothetical protein [Nitrospira sp.]